MLFTAVAVFLATAAAATAQTIVEITEQDCSQLVRHVAAADVTYQPGVDVNGDAVAPADLDTTGQITVPEIISFPLTIDLSERLGLPADTLARTVIGDIEVMADGRVTFNGQLLTSDEQHELAQRCQQVVK